MPNLPLLTPLNGVTKENMYRAWQSIADQYWMLNLNVTTSRAVYDAARAANQLRTGVINFVNADGRSNAPLRSFGTTAAAHCTATRRQVSTMATGSA